MRRRALLASLAAGTAALAGCAGAGDDDADTTTRDTSTTRATTRTATTTRTTTTERDAGDDAGVTERPASVVEAAVGPRTYSLWPTGMHADDGARVELAFDRTATFAHPARVRGFLENTNEFANVFRVEWLPVVGRTRGKPLPEYDHDGVLYVAPTERNDLAESVPVVRRGSEGYWQVARHGEWMPRRVKLDAGERVTLEYVLVGGPESPGRPTGVYEFSGDEESARVAVWNSDSPGPEAKSRFAGRSVPAVSDDAATQWFHDADASTPVFVRPSRERVALDGRVTFEAVNHSHGTLGCGHWNLYKLVEGAWYHVAPSFHYSLCKALRPGERKEWALRAFHGDPVGCDCEGLGATRGYLGGGVYGVVAGYGHPAAQSGALVELVGDAVTVTLTGDASVARDGDTAVVTSGRWNDGEGAPNASLAVTRAASASERLIAEQLMRSNTGFGYARALRNAVAAMTENVERVVVRTDERAVSAALNERSVRRFRFRGQAYEARRAGTR